MCAELEVNQVFTDILCQLEVVLDERYRGWQQPAHMAADEVGQSQHPQQKEVPCQKQVDVLLAEDLPEGGVTNYN